MRRRRGSKSFASALLVAALVAISIPSCVHVPQVVVFRCPDIPDAVLVEMAEKSPLAFEWWRIEMDPWCEKLEVAHAAD